MQGWKMGEPVSREDKNHYLSVRRQWIRMDGGEREKNEEAGGPEVVNRNTQSVRLLSALTLNPSARSSSSYIHLASEWDTPQSFLYCFPSHLWLSHLFFPPSSSRTLASVLHWFIFLFSLHPVDHQFICLSNHVMKWRGYLLSTSFQRMDEFKQYYSTAGRVLIARISADQWNDYNSMQNPCPSLCVSVCQMFVSPTQHTLHFTQIRRQKQEL